MRLFADRVLPVLQRDAAFTASTSAPEKSAASTTRENVFAPA